MWPRGVLHGGGTDGAAGAAGTAGGATERPEESRGGGAGRYEGLAPERAGGGGGAETRLAGAADGSSTVGAWPSAERSSRTFASASRSSVRSSCVDSSESGACEGGEGLDGGGADGLAARASTSERTDGAGAPPMGPPVVATVGASRSSAPISSVHGSLSSRLGMTVVGPDSGGSEGGGTESLAAGRGGAGGNETGRGGGAAGGGSFAFGAEGLATGVGTASPSASCIARADGQRRGFSSASALSTTAMSSRGISCTRPTRASAPGARPPGRGAC